MWNPFASRKGEPERTLYEVLGVPEDASNDRIKAAWRDAAKRLHPDQNRSGNAPREFDAVAKAAAVLLDYKSRVDYDRELADGRARAKRLEKPEA